MIGQRIRFGLLVGTMAALLVGLMAALAALTDEPFIFPSLGATVYLLLTAPGTPAASARATVAGHAIGAASGLLALAVFGLRTEPAAVANTIGATRVGAVALALGLTCAVMVATGLGHPPAGATTLIVSLGFLRTVEQVAILMVAIVVVVVLTGASSRWLLRGRGSSPAPYSL